MLASLDLREELCLYLHHDDGNCFPIDIGADGCKIVGLGCVVELEIDGVVDVPELIHVVETNLDGQHVPEICTLFLYHDSRSVNVLSLLAEDAMLAILSTFMLLALASKISL